MYASVGLATIFKNLLKVYSKENAWHAQLLSFISMMRLKSLEKKE